MPKINLRLTDEELDLLRAWSQESHRSIQREAVFRLFNERSLSERGEVLRGNEPSEEVRVPSTLSVDRPRSESDLHFKPDFK